MKLGEGMTEVSRHKYFGGQQLVVQHESKELKCNMKFGVYLPPGYETEGPKLPVLYFLSGLTCTEENFMNKSGMQRVAAQYNIVVINPDTSPRGSDHPNEHKDWDFGSGAGFYLDASAEPWSANYRMYSYVLEELLPTVNGCFNVDSERAALSGHSMGGHGALVITLRNPDLFKCTTALAPISNPSEGPWGVKAFSNFLGEDKSKWAEWDATELVKKFEGGPGKTPINLLVCQGEKDRFLEKELLTGNFIEAAAGNPAIEMEYRMREGYDHFYPYIATVIEEHFQYVARFIC